jgi:hypothetical protein
MGVRLGVQTMAIRRLSREWRSQVAATGDRMDEKVPENPDCIKTTCGCSHGVPGVQTAVAPAPPARDAAYHALRLGIDPQAWMLILALLPMAFMRLPSRSKAWLVLQRLAERIETVGLRGILTMKFGRSRAPDPHPQGPAGRRRKPRARHQGGRRRPRQSDRPPTA